METKLSLKPKHPWYCPEVKQQKAKVLRHEKKWLKYKFDSLWLAYKKERNRYYALLNHKKTECYRTKVDECKRDPCKLHQLISNLTNKQEVQSWPKHTSKEELANNFAKFFESKILTIREKFMSIPQYRPDENDAVPRLRKFAPLTTTQVELIIKSMKPKSCKLDIIPTQLLKEMLPTLLPTITEIVNLSLSQGTFCDNWKTAIVHPLLKKIGLDLIESNFRPVSNLSFLSKLVEKCMWLQVSEHCLEYSLVPDYQSAY